MTFDEWKNCDWGVLEKVTVEQIEAQNTYADDGRVPHVPFGFANAKWLALKGRVLPGDEFFFFSSNAKAWENLAGREGYALVRNGEVVDTLLTMMN